MSIEKTKNTNSHISEYINIFFVFNYYVWRKNNGGRTDEV